MDQDRKRYKRQLQLWRLRGLDSANQNAIFECANSSPCVTFEPLDGGSKAPTSWLRASILISGDAAQIALQHQQGVNLWRQLIRVCQAGGGKA